MMKRKLLNRKYFMKLFLGRVKFVFHLVMFQISSHNRDWFSIKTIFFLMKGRVPEELGEAGGWEKRGESENGDRIMGRFLSISAKSYVSSLPSYAKFTLHTHAKAEYSQAIRFVKAAITKSRFTKCALYLRKCQFYCRRANESSS